MLQLSDGVKKWAILAPTYPLPARLRVSLRRKYLSQLEMGKAERARLLIIGHPKSGNTWLKVMLSRLYQVRYGLAANRLINTDELARKHPSIPRLAASNGYYSYEGVIGAALLRCVQDNDVRLKHLEVGSDLVRIRFTTRDVQRRVLAEQASDAKVEQRLVGQNQNSHASLAIPLYAHADSIS